MSGHIIWDLRDGPLGVAMIAAALTGFVVASAQSSGTGLLPRLAARSAEADAAKAQPRRMLRIQVRSDPLATLQAGTVIPTAADPPRPPPATLIRLETTAPAAPAARPVSTVSYPIPAPMAVRSVSVPIAALAAPRAAPNLPQRTEEDFEIADADRELAAVYRAASQAGVSAADLRADRQAWRIARADAADRSRGALLDAYRDHIDDVRDMADEAQASTRPQRRYADDPRWYPPAYAAQQFPRY